MRISDNDLPFFTSELKTLDRQKKREYRKNKKSQKYFCLKSKYDALYEKTSKQYFDNVIDKLLKAKPGQAYSLLSKLGARPGESDDTSSFTLPNHEGFTIEQSADAIADYFADVSQ